MDGWTSICRCGTNAPVVECAGCSVRLNASLSRTESRDPSIYPEPIPSSPWPLTTARSLPTNHLWRAVASRQGWGRQEIHPCLIALQTPARPQVQAMYFTHHPSTPKSAPAHI
jgi:hypothetical protein